MTHHQCLVCQIPNRGTSYQWNNEIRRKLLARWLHVKKPTIHSTRKTVVAKLKKAGQPRNKIIQVTGHARESTLDDYDEITEDERMQLSHIASGYVARSLRQLLSTAFKRARLRLQLPLAWNLFHLRHFQNAWWKKISPLIHLGCFVSACQLDLWQWRQNISSKRRYRCSISVCSTMRFQIPRGQTWEKGV